MALLVALVSSSLLTARQASAAPRPATGADAASGQQAQGGKSHLVQDPSWVAAKHAGMIRRHQPQAQIIQPDTIQPPAFTLSSTVTGTFWEPLGGSGPDASGVSYKCGTSPCSDDYMWKLCGPGATAVTLYYWGHPVTSNGGHNYTDARTTSFWNDTYARSYIMYLATTSDPPSYVAPGEETYQTYPNAITFTTDLRDALNWEASGHNTSTWSTFWYTYDAASTLTQADLVGQISSDIYFGNVPAVVDVNTNVLPDWAGTGKALAHFVAVIGYNNTNGTFTYIDTCGTGCGSNGNGVYTISQTALYNGVENNNGLGGLVW